MIKSLEIKNFKAFGKNQIVPIKPLTLLFGQNSVGKSSLIHALLYIEEFARNRTTDIHEFKKNNKLVDLGGANQFVHRDKQRMQIGGTFEHKESFLCSNCRAFLKHFCFLEKDEYSDYKKFNIEGSFTWKVGIDFSSEIKGCISHIEIKNTKVSIELPFKKNIYEGRLKIEDLEWEDCKTRRIKTGKSGSLVYEMEFGVKHNTLLSFREDNDSKYLVCTDRTLFHPGSYCLLGEDQIDDSQFIVDTLEKTNKLEVDSTFDKENESRIKNFRLHILDKGLTIRVRRVNKNGQHENDHKYLMFEIEINNYFEAFLHKLSKSYSSLSYIPPLRSILKRDSFSIEDFLGTYWQQSLENKEYRDVVNEILTHPTLLDLDYELVIENFDSQLRNKTLETVVLKNKTNGKLLSFRDVGTGLSQLLPIVGAIASTHERTILMEQPELHLHPGLQSRLGKVLARVPNSGNKAIVETHSEHLIKAVQLEVARYKSTNEKKGLNKNDVAVLYLSQEEGQAIVREINLDEVGSFTEPWPDDFFDSSADLTMERLKFMSKNMN